MKTTLSVIKADVGSIGGHIKPSARLKETVERFVREKGKKLLARRLCQLDRRRRGAADVA